MLVLYISELLVIAFACKEKSFAIAIIFFFLFFSTTNLDERQFLLLVKFSQFVKLAESGLIQIHWRNITGEMFIPI